MNTLNIMLYSEILAFCFILILCIAGKVYQSEKPENGSRLLRFNLCIAFTVVINFLWINANGNTIASVSTVKLVTVLYYFALNTSFYFWMRYSEGELYPSAATVKSYLFISAAPYIIINILVVASCFFGWIFTVDDLNHFQSGPLWVAEYVFIFATLLWSAGTAFSFTSKTTDPEAKRKGSQLASFVILPFVCLLLHVFAKGSPLGVIALSLLSIFSYRELSRAEAQAAKDEATRQEQEYLARLQEAEERFKYAEQLRTSFLRRITIDFSGPLATIAALTEKARGCEDNPAALTDYLNKIQFTGNYLSQMLTDISEMSDLEAGTLKLKDELTSLPAEAEELTEAFRTEAEEAGIAFTADSSEIRDELVWHDAKRLRQLLTNIFENAKKNAGEDGEINFSILQVEGAAPDVCSYIFSINDNGPELSEEEIARLFEVSEESADGGTGFSLALVKKLTELMGGKLNIESTAQQGTTVSVFLSFSMPSEADLEALQPAEDEETAEEASDEAADGQPDDEAATDEEQADTEAAEETIPEADEPEEAAAEDADSTEAADQAETADAVAEDDDNPDDDDAQYLPQPEELLALKNLKILLADDDEHLREEEKDFLESLGTDVTNATGGADIIEKVRNAQPGQYDVLMIDAKMPHINGFEAAQTIRTFNDFRLSGLPIIIMDYDASPEARQQAKKLGADGLVSKPLELRGIVKALKRYKK